MGFFDKKYCDFCGEKIGLLGDKKLRDGHMCKVCEKKISDYIRDRKEWSVDEMRMHLIDREQNYETLRNINLTNVLCSGRNRVYFDCEQGYFFKCWTDRYLDENPDLIGFWHVTGCTTEIRESKSELTFEAEDKDHRKKNIKYEPAEYKYDYDFYVTVMLREFFVKSITIKVNDNDVCSVYTPEYKQNEDTMLRLKAAFDQMAAGANPVVIPEPIVLDPTERIELERKQRRFEEEQKRRMERFEDRFFGREKPVPQQKPVQQNHVQQKPAQQTPGHQQAGYHNPGHQQVGYHNPGHQQADYHNAGHQQAVEQNMGMNHNPNQGYNQKPEYNQNQGYNQNPNYNPDQGYHNGPAYNQKPAGKPGRGSGPVDK